MIQGMRKNKVTDFSGVKTAVIQANHIMLVTHVAPDGDAIGSLTAAGLALRQLQKRVTLMCDDPAPPRFHYLSLVDRITPKHETNADYDLIIALDCGDAERMGNVYQNLPNQDLPLINIDHHVTNNNFGTINIVDLAANATTEILFDLLPVLGVTLTQEIAMSLLTGLVTDTLGFRTNGVTAHTLTAAGKLIEAGADLPLITMQGLILKPISTLLLWQKGLNNMRIDDGLIWATITAKERKEVGHMASSSSGLVNILAEVQSAAMSAVLLEMDNGTVSVGFRCRPPYKVSELAMNLGGGGHDLAAGCTLESSLDKAESLVVALAKESIQQQRAFLKDSDAGYQPDLGWAE
jgi:bifunctional oligoribonuclease and PAP phosphatase NrnA